MYHIDLKTDKPDITMMMSIMQEKMHRGVRVADCKKIRDYFSNLRDTLASNFAEEYGISNPNSHVQVKGYIKAMSLRTDGDKRNDIVEICYDDETGKWRTDAEAMTQLADIGYEFAQDLLDYRQAKKNAETFESILKYIDENGLIHPEVTLGKTNRLNYSNPGLMTIKKKLMWNVLAPFNEGDTLFSVDVKNQEPSILLNMTGDEELKDVLRSDEGLYETLYKRCFSPKAVANVLVDVLDEDRQYTYGELRELGTVSPAMYTAVKPMISGYTYKGKKVVEIETVCVGCSQGAEPKLPKTVSIGLEDGSIETVEVVWETVNKRKSTDYTVLGDLKGIEIEISKQERKEFKSSYLAISYGASIKGIERLCHTIDGKWVYKYVTGIKALKEYRAKIKKLAKEGTTTIGTIFGTPIFSEVESYDKKRLERVLLDLPIQGSGADILSLLIKHFYEYIKENSLTDKMDIYFTRHDELIIEVDKEFLASAGEDKVKGILKEIFEHQINDWVPFKVEINKAAATELDIDFGDYGDFGDEA